MTEIGHKFARLEALRTAGFPVPGLWCLPAAEFDRALGALRDSLPPPASVPPPDWCAAAASALAGAVPDGDLAARLLAAFDEHVAAGGTVAVRACVVPGEGGGEDSADDPFAGMSDSFLYVPRHGLLAAVARCWASAFKAEAVHYRMLRGLDPTAARVAVGIQRMVPGSRSFVAFTRDPRDGARRHVVAAAHGIGEGVVQEKADVDHFFVGPDTGRVSAETVVKRRMVGPPADGETGPAVTEVPKELRDVPVLTGDEVRRVADLAAAGALDDPMDVRDLTVEEVIGAFDGTLPGADLRGLVAVRRAERERHRSVPPPPALLTLAAGRPVAAALARARPLGAPEDGAADGAKDGDGAGEGSALRGLGSSGGTVRGRAKVVLDPGVAPADCAGRILVARETDPGWLPLMIAASGLVVERGTLLSHTAVTGRLLGVPTVVAVGGAARRIPDGAWIELDGRAGTVRILTERAGR